MARPVIGISPEFEEYQEIPGRDKSYIKLYHHYYHCVFRAGGLPVILPVLENPEAVLALLPRLDGVLLTGGDDYPPQSYGRVAHPTVRFMPPWRADQDLKLVGNLLKASTLPVLAICAGFQALAVAAGGELYQHLPDEYPKGLAHGGGVQHTVRVEPDSRLAASYPDGTSVYSLHHQGIKNLGEGLKAVAHAPDGLVEAAEGIDAERWLVAVQWHPERLPTDAATMRLFQDFVSACERR